MSDRIKKNFLYIVLIILISIPAIIPLFNKGFFVTDDAEWMIIRFSAFHQALRDGQFPVRFLGRLNQEYGYPVANFLYPGFMYFTESIHVIGYGFIDSIKILLVLSMILSGVFTYLWLKKFFDKVASLVGALFYIYTPYHLYDLYKRGSVGEILALAIVPFIFWQLERKNILWSAIGIGALIISHNTLAVLFLGLIICYLALDFVIAKNNEQKKLLVNYLAILLLGIGTSAFFWLPAIYELQYTVFAKTTVSNWREYFAPISLIGHSTFIVLILIIFNFLTKRIILKKHRLTVLLFLICIASIFFSTSASYQLWNILPINFIQFPFRILSLVILCTAFLSAVSISVLKGKFKFITAVALIIILIFSASPFLNPTIHFDKEDGYYSTNMATTTVQDEYMPLWVKQKPLQRPEKKVETINGEGSIENVNYNSKQISFAVNLKKDTIIQVNTIYWPGWSAFVDGKKVDIRYNNPGGVMQLSIPPRNHNVILMFEETPMRLFADTISLLSLLILIFITYVTHFVIPGRKPGIYLASD